MTDTYDESTAANCVMQDDVFALDHRGDRVGNVVRGDHVVLLTDAGAFGGQ